MANDDGTANTKPDIAFFFVSYIIVGNIVLLNVVVAVLLDEFIASGIDSPSIPCCFTSLLSSSLSMRTTLRAVITHTPDCGGICGT